MKRRAWKYAALVASGGIVLQAAGCATLFTDVVVQQLISTFFSALLAALTGGTGTT